MGLLISIAYAAGQNPPPSLTTIYSFTSGTDGGNPDVPLIIGEGGILYGATYWGGNKNYGAVFSLTAPASPGGTWAEAVLYSSKAATMGSIPIHVWRWAAAECSTAQPTAEGSTTMARPSR